MRKIRSWFLAGVLVTAPISLTFYLAWLLLSFIDLTVAQLVPEKYNPATYLPFSIPGIGIILIVFFLIFVGFLTAGYIGRFFVVQGEKIVSYMPIISNIYSVFKQIFETVLSQKSTAFREAVLIEYPRKGIWAIGFITGTTKEEVKRVLEEKMINIFLPTTPNPTSGFLLFVPERDIIRLDMTVEEAMKKVISAGIVTPEDRQNRENKGNFLPLIEKSNKKDGLRH